MARDGKGSAVSTATERSCKCLARMLESSGTAAYWADAFVTASCMRIVEDLVEDAAEAQVRTGDGFPAGVSSTGHLSSESSHA